MIDVSEHTYAGPLNSILEAPHSFASAGKTDTQSTSRARHTSLTLPIQKPLDDDKPEIPLRSSARRSPDKGRPTKKLVNIPQDSARKKKRGSMFSFFSTSKDHAVDPTEQAAHPKQKSTRAAKKTTPFDRVSASKSSSETDRRDSGVSSSRRWTSNSSFYHASNEPETQRGPTDDGPFDAPNAVTNMDRAVDATVPIKALQHAIPSPLRPPPRRPVSPMSDEDTAPPSLPTIPPSRDAGELPPSPITSVSPAQSFTPPQLNDRKPASLDDLLVSQNRQLQLHADVAEQWLRQESSVSSLGPISSSQWQASHFDVSDPPSPVAERPATARQPQRPARFDDDDYDLYARPEGSHVRQPSHSMHTRAKASNVEEAQPKRDSPLQVESRFNDANRGSKCMPSYQEDVAWVSGLNEVTVTSRPVVSASEYHGTTGSAPALQLEEPTPPEQPPRQLFPTHSRTPSGQAPATLHLAPAPEQYRRSLHAERSIRSESSRSNSASRSRSGTPPHHASKRHSRTLELSGRSTRHSRQQSNNSMSSYMNSSQISDTPHQVAEASVVQFRPTCASPVQVMFPPSTTPNQSRQSLDTITPHQTYRHASPGDNAGSRGRQSHELYRPLQSVLRPKTRLRASSDAERGRHTRNFSKPFVGRDSPGPASPTQTTSSIQPPEAPTSPSVVTDGFSTPGLALVEPLDANDERRRSSTALPPSAASPTPTVARVPKSTAQTSDATAPDSLTTALRTRSEHETASGSGPASRTASTSASVDDSAAPVGRRGASPLSWSRDQYRVSGRDITVVPDELMGDKVTETSKEYALSVSFWEAAVQRTRDGEGVVVVASSSSEEKKSGVDEEDEDEEDEEQLQLQQAMQCRLAGPFDPSASFLWTQ